MVLKPFWTCFEDSQTGVRSEKELLWGMEFSAAQTVLADLSVPTSKGLRSPLPSTQAEKKSLVCGSLRLCVSVQC